MQIQDYVNRGLFKDYDSYRELYNMAKEFCSHSQEYNDVVLDPFRKIGWLYNSSYDELHPYISITVGYPANSDEECIGLMVFSPKGYKLAGQIIMHPDYYLTKLEPGNDYLKSVGDEWYHMLFIGLRNIFTNTKVSKWDYQLHRRGISEIDFEPLDLSLRYFDPDKFEMLFDSGLFPKEARFLSADKLVELTGSTDEEKKYLQPFSHMRCSGKFLDYLRDIDFNDECEWVHQFVCTIDGNPRPVLFYLIKWKNGRYTFRLPDGRLELARRLLSTLTTIVHVLCCD